MIREKGRRTNLRPHIFNRRDGKALVMGAQWSLHPTIRGWYLGTIAKGWWRLGPWKGMEHFELELAIGGEDNMAQAGIVLPFLGRVHAGIRVPRRLTKGWIYQRRSWMLRVGYVGRWVELLIASDEDMRDTGMVSYYRDKIARGEELSWSRAALWPGWHLTFRPELRDRLLGRRARHEEILKAVRAVVPMPEGNYPCTVTLTRSEFRRPRWPFNRLVTYNANVEPDVPIPVPGKGENSWDCDDDAIYSSFMGARSVAEAVTEVAQSALRTRERYASREWVPAAGWSDKLAGRTPA